MILAAIQADREKLALIDHAIGKLIVPPTQARELVLAMYKTGLAPWDRCYQSLFNAGWRGPMDRDGFPTTPSRGGFTLRTP